MNNSNLIFIGTRGTALCIDQNNGKELWRTSLPGSAYAPVTVFHEDGRVFCGSNGKVYIICSITGKILAQNEMIGQGYGVITFTTKKSESPQQPQVQQPQPMIQQPQYIIQQPIIQQVNELQYVQQQPMYPQFPQSHSQPQFVQQEECQKLLGQQFDLDEEYARSIDRELNGNQQNNNNNRNNRLMNFNNNNNLNNLLRQNFYYANNDNSINGNNIQNVISIDDIIFVGLNSFVTAISKSTGQDIWRAYVPTSFGLPLSIVYTKGKINVASCGHIFCLNAYNGKELWRNSLPGLRYTNVSIVSSTNNNNFCNSNSPFLNHAQN